MKLVFDAPGNRARSYRQKEFIFSTFHIGGNSGVEMSEEEVRAALTKIKELGMNQVELAWTHHENAWQALDVSREIGTDVVLQDMTLFGGFQDRFHKETTEDEIRAVAEKTKDNPRLLGYYIWDEPWNDEDLESAAKQTDWFDAYAPGKLGFSVMVPSYNPLYTWNGDRYPFYVDKFLDTVKPPVGSFDYYPFGIIPATEDSEDQLDNSALWKDLAVVSRACLARKIPFWFYIQVIRMRGHKPYPKIRFSMLTLQMNYALLYGAKAIQCYGIAGSKQSPDGLDEKQRILERDYREGTFYDDMKTAIREVKMLGKTLLALNSRHVYHGSEVLPDDAYFNGHLRENVADDELLAIPELPFRCSVGVLADDFGNEYLAILNRDYHETRTFSLPLRRTSRLYEVSRADGRQYPVNDGTDRVTVTLSPSALALYRVEDAKKAPEDIEYECR